MQITATHIDGWARTKEAQGSLPRLVRRLLYASGLVRQGSFPAGDSTSLPGWDGELLTEEGNPWIPRGMSFWEFSCEGRVTNKANRDYDKRTQATPEDVRQRATFVFVSARRWSAKAEWLKDKRTKGHWADVRAYDAVDLEQWLEQSPAVALQFAEELGLVGPGVVSVAKFWTIWSQQSDPPISIEAMFTGREEARTHLVDNVRRRINTYYPKPYVVRADSVEEAVAFVCAALLDHEDLSASSVVVTETNGWRFVDQNPTLRVAVAGRTEIAEAPTLRNGLVVIIPHAAGDVDAHDAGDAPADQSSCLRLERPRIHDFEKALVSMGIGESDARRLAASAGRSWSVFRRRRATNPAICKPTWLEVPQAAALSTVCLLGAWSANRDADRTHVERLSGRDYEEVERDLQYLATLDDAPVVRIGDVWKAKAPLELLDLFGPRITRDEIDRFFAIARDVLLAPAPELDLPKDQRFAAPIYGKARPESGLLIRSLCDTLVKLAVRSPRALKLADIEGRIEAFVHDLLHDADDIRWLSLASFLPYLAEAAPNAFLRAVERSITSPKASITRLFAETDSSNCWHSGLLWALETLVWAPERLTRVVLILARLAHVEIKGNWANTPMNTLVSIFRSWYPQTAASLEQRIAALDTLMARDPDIAFDLLDRLVFAGQDFAHPNHRPAWRDDDSGAGYGVTQDEFQRMLSVAADRLVSCSRGHPKRLARLIEKMSDFDEARVTAILELVEQYAASPASDEDKEVVRSALRKRLHWYLNYDKTHGMQRSRVLQAMERLYETLAPKDLLVRHRWLFSNGWCELPVRMGDDYAEKRQAVEKWRGQALQEIFAERGIMGIEQLATSCPNARVVGQALVHLDLDTDFLGKWMVQKVDRKPSPGIIETIRGLLHSLPHMRSEALIRTVLDRGQKQGWDADRIASFLALAPQHRTTWNIAGAFGTEVEKAYWVKAEVSPFLQGDAADLEFALRRLLEAGRPRSAFLVCHLALERIDAEFLALILERILNGEETDGPIPDTWRIGEAVSRLEESGAIDRDRLILLEFRLIAAFRYGIEQEAKTLYDTMMSDPHLFVQMLSLVYGSASGEHKQTPSTSRVAAAEAAWYVLHQCRRVPGLQPNGQVNGTALVNFIDKARELSRTEGLIYECDLTLGQILAHAPADPDGLWPCQPVRDLLDRPELDNMRHGFSIGVYNKRGATWRACDAGGEQERRLADLYRRHARALQNSHVNVAAVLEAIARTYEKEGLQEDVDAKLHREGC